METHDSLNTSRRRFLTAASASAAAAALFVPNLAAETAGGEQSGSASSEAAPSLKLDRADTAVVIIDPQNDVLSERGSLRRFSTKV